MVRDRSDRVMRLWRAKPAKVRDRWHECGKYRPKTKRCRTIDRFWHFCVWWSPPTATNDFFSISDKPKIADNFQTVKNVNRNSFGLSTVDVIFLCLPLAAGMKRWIKLRGCIRQGKKVKAKITSLDWFSLSRLVQQTFILDFKLRGMPMDGG